MLARKSAHLKFGRRPPPPSRRTRGFPPGGCSMNTVNPPQLMWRARPGGTRWPRWRSPPTPGHKPTADGSWASSSVWPTCSARELRPPPPPRGSRRRPGRHLSRGRPGRQARSSPQIGGPPRWPLMTAARRGRCTRARRGRGKRGRNGTSARRWGPSSPRPRFPRSAGHPSRAQPPPVRSGSGGGWGTRGTAGRRRNGSSPWRRSRAPAGTFCSPAW
mmetsp:Transcript_79115/g.228804  ORF Transcript_79115/g.228804 Transcript_79115/m.228804 type:complete len:217 (-) Transcript_79115:971-1621(-)